MESNVFIRLIKNLVFSDFFDYTVGCCDYFDYTIGCCDYFDHTVDCCDYFDYTVSCCDYIDYTVGCVIVPTKITGIIAHQLLL